MKQLKLLNFPKRTNRGDTIVEVLIAITVVAVVLTGAFYSTNRSTRTVRDSEEHAQALQYLQGQTELLRGAALATGFNNSGVFCFDDSGTKVLTGSPSSPACTKDSRYVLTIQKVASGVSPNTNTYSLTATWDSVLGDKANINIFYKI